MKKVMNKNKAIIVGLMAIISTSFSNPVSAMDKQSDPPGVEIKYLGFVNNNPVFEILTNNVQTDYFFITIRDEAGTVLFSEKLSGKKLSRRYRIDTEEEITDGGLRFEVRSVNSKKTDVYIAGVTENITREVAVTKIQ
ncbi:MAG TPA: hypothetical protein VGQ04_02215 [Chitinophagaceae bacterium]|jgi:hypothetical protein|nr:hypothetical protein [Chitinophagaceae bacterium]